MTPASVYRQARSSVARSPHDIPTPAVSLQVNAVRRVPGTRVLVFGNVPGRALSGELLPGDPDNCPYTVNGTVSGNVLTGTYATANCSVSAGAPSR